ncbi:hypothetical protein NE235_36440 [Actinoallomurus spadix]|uniref:Uncharacterized protein n=1 Tax=Actinoallomurus spadix TaxID=79912 RepID=A0ABN0WXI3_9ACTN|nr:hypothetical protein [Actinoallomurus spadix]MCO5991619.1 hypothetical protein [Actinoallomurus spadix]
MTAQPIVPGDLFARHQTIKGLRALADFLENNPGVPVNTYGWDLTHHARGTDEHQAAEVDRIAVVLDAVPVDDRPDGGHYTVTKTFGRITYTAVHVPAHRMAAHNALMSYADVFHATTDQDAA